MAQIAFHTEIRIEPIGEMLAVLQMAAEFFLQGFLRKIGYMCRHTRHCQTFGRVIALSNIIAVAPIRIRHYRLPADFVERNILRRLLGSWSQHRS